MQGGATGERIPFVGSAIAGRDALVSPADSSPCCVVRAPVARWERALRFKAVYVLDPAEDGREGPPPSEALFDLQETVPVIQ